MKSFSETAEEELMLRIAIIIGSTRPGRNGEAVGKWVYEIAQKRSDAEFELVDIKDFNLPLLDEPMPPIMGQYSKPHTKAWAAFDGNVFVTPERDDVARQGWQRLQARGKRH
jgi:NAD(P)H-dependent FMN reductase